MFNTCLDLLRGLILLNVVLQNFHKVCYRSQFRRLYYLGITALPIILRLIIFEVVLCYCWIISVLSISLLLSLHTFIKSVLWHVSLVIRLIPFVFFHVLHCLRVEFSHQKALALASLTKPCPALSAKVYALTTKYSAILKAFVASLSTIPCVAKSLVAP